MHLMFLNRFNKILLALCLLVLFSCASVKAPQGGPLDSEPPKLKSTSPTILTNLNQGQQITLFFNEFIKEESLKNAIELFPNVNQKIDFEYYGKEVIITLPSNLDKFIEPYSFFGTTTCTCLGEKPYEQLLTFKIF